MTASSNLTLTIAFTDPELDAEERDEQAQRLLSELSQLENLVTVGRVLDPNPPEDNKTVGGFWVGLLTAEVNATNAKKLFGFLGVGFASLKENRLGGKPIELMVEGNSKSSASKPTAAKSYRL